ncbi:hypothetical protein LTR28_008359 [Elasticomyces elasticus]|nr:hypothetical protein LTR28_008359 [Elasticomyces elasticus]
MQHDTLSHLILTRLSTIHPFHGSHDSLQLAQRSGSIYAAYDMKIADFQTKCAETEGGANLIIELNSLRLAFKNSLMMPLSLLEQRRIAHITGQDHEISLGEQLHHTTSDLLDNLQDNRDYRSGFNHDRGDPSGDDRSLIGRLGVSYKAPGQHWLLYCLLTDTAWSLVNGQSPLILDLDELENRVGSFDSTSPELSIAEASHFPKWITLYSCIEGVTQRTRSEELEKLREDIRHLPPLGQATSSESYASEDLHACYERLNFLKAAWKLSALVKDKNIQQAIQTGWDEAQRVVKDRRRVLPTKRSLCEATKGGETGQALLECVGSGIEDWAEMVEKDYAEAWAGVARVKLV